MTKPSGVAGSPAGRHVLVCGASFAGLSTAFWMNRLGYTVTIVEIADGLKKGGTPVDIGGSTIGIAARMGLLDAIKSRSLPPRITAFKDSDDVTLGPPSAHAGQTENDEYEIERDVLLDILHDAIAPDVTFLFNTTIAALTQTDDDVAVTFRDGTTRHFALVFGCDGSHSVVRQLQFGPERDYAHFLGLYFSITIVDRLLIAQDTTQIYNAPGKAVMLNAYNNKTDIVLCFHSDNEIAYDYRDQVQQRRIIRERLADSGWKTLALLAEVNASNSFYFDKLCQIKMPDWSKGRVALVGDAAYCASPAAGMGGSLAIIGAAALADAFEQHPNDVAAAFRAYDESLRPFITEVQANAVDHGLEMFAPRTEEAIRRRNAQLSAS